MAAAPPQNVTQMLRDWRSGKQEALSQLMPLVYDELRRLAAYYMQRERKEHTLQPTALVNEAYLRLVDVKISWQDRAHFFAVAARLMRRLLVDHARAQQRLKHGADALHIELENAENVSTKPSWDVVALDEAMTRLAGFDPRKSDIVELHFFGGLDNDEIAEALGISRATVQRDLRLAKAWLKHELQTGP
jgi:RNA polymerase sigma factor (TIGR02999 family)